MPIHNRDQIQEPFAHRDIADVRAPDLVGPVHDQITQQIRIDLVMGVRIGGSGLAVNRPQPHQAHQPSHTVTTGHKAIAPQEPRHLTRPEEGMLQKNLVDPPHQGQIFRALATGTAVDARPRYRQKLRLPSNT